MSAFNPDTFMEQGTSDASSTTFEPIPQGEYPGIIDDVKIRQAKESVLMDVTWLLQAPDVAAKIGREKLSVRQSFFLDIDSNGGLDNSKGKNVSLGRLREAVGQNTPGVAWKPPMLKGQLAKVNVTLRPDKNNSDVIYNDVKSVGKM